MELQISKLDAARRQVEMAIRLYFQQADPVSIHTLTAAAYELLRDLNKHRGGRPMIMKEGILDHIKPEFRKEWYRVVNEAENFFKHADNDPDRALAFNPDQSELLILECCQKYRELTGEMLPVMTLFESWAFTTFAKNLVVDDEFQRAREKFVSSLHNPSRQQFYATFLPILDDLQTGKP